MINPYVLGVLSAIKKKVKLKQNNTPPLLYSIFIMLKRHLNFKYLKENKGLTSH